MENLITKQTAFNFIKLMFNFVVYKLPLILVFHLWYPRAVFNDKDDTLKIYYKTSWDSDHEYTRTFSTLKNKNSSKTTFIYVLSSGMGFWLWTNLGVWLTSSLYTKNISTLLCDSRTMLRF